MKYQTLKRCWRLALALTLLGRLSFAQDPSTSVVASPSPASAALARYTEYPVDLSTGVPLISIPLHVINSTQLTYPLTLSYHAAGVKVNSVAGPLGTGWDLNFAQISRIMRGRPDEQAEGFFSNAGAIPDESDPLTLQLKNDLSTRQTDMMPDLFYYSTGVTSGTIIFDNQLVPRTLPQTPVKIETDTATLSTFTFSDPMGTNYEFEAGETATASLPEGGGNITYIASWYLSRIVSADKLDTIRFNYTLSSSYSYTTSENLGLNFFFNVPAGAARALNEMNALNSNVNITVTGTRYLSSIQHKVGKVTFSFSGGRSDDSNGKKLDHIIVYSKDPVTGAYVESRRILFSYSYFENTDSGTRLRLDSFREKIGSTYNPPYVFGYSVKKLPAPGSAAQDFWGYYNGAESNTSLIPAFTLGTFVVSENDREVHPDYVQGCILHSITNPRGGITEYTFESNDYWGGTSNKPGPGLRIGKITRRDPFTSIVATTNYDYTNPSTGNSSGLLTNQPSYLTQLDVVDHTHGNWFYYDCLLIKMMATGVGNFSGAPVIYEYVTTYSNDNVKSTGKTVSHFSTYTPPLIDFPYFPVPDNSWAAGNLLSREMYQVQNDDSTLVKKIENTYEEGAHVFTIKGLSCARDKIFFFTDPGINDFIVKNYVVQSKFVYLKETKIYDYEQNNGAISLQTTITNSFDTAGTHLFPVSVETTTSISSDMLKKEFKYVADVPSTGVFAVMKNLNMIGLPVETITSVIKSGSEYVTGYEKTEYFEWQPNKIYPKYVYVGKIPINTAKNDFMSDLGNYTRLRAQINAYGNTGTPTETEVPGDRPQAVVIDSKINRVVASATEASAGQIAYTGFESTDFGGWIVNAGTSTLTAYANLNLSHTFETMVLSSGQTINYSYTVTRSSGPNPVLVFFKEGATPIEKLLSGISGNGSVNLTAGSWNVSLQYDLNVTALEVEASYQYVSPNQPSIATAQFKTGQRSLQLGMSQTIQKTNLPSGKYTLAYYQKGGTVTVTATGGASVLSTVTSPADPDGWSKVQKEINISSGSQGIQITGTTSIYLDELRLCPTGSFMTTTSYDTFGNVITTTDVNLRSQFIEYDERRRVKLVRNHEGDILRHYDYELAIN